MSQQSLLVTVSVIIIGATAYFLFYNTSDQAALKTSPVVQELEARLAELRHLKDIRFDTSVLQDNFFKSLSLPDIPQPPDVKIGRLNPFIPF